MKDRTFNKKADSNPPPFFHFACLSLKSGMSHIHHYSYALCAYDIGKNDDFLDFHSRWAFSKQMWNLEWLTSPSLMPDAENFDIFSIDWCRDWFYYNFVLIFTWHMSKKDHLLAYRSEPGLCDFMSSSIFQDDIYIQSNIQPFPNVTAYYCIIELTLKNGRVRRNAIKKRVKPHFKSISFSI